MVFNERFTFHLLHLQKGGNMNGRCIACHDLHFQILTIQMDSSCTTGTEELVPVLAEIYSAVVSERTHILNDSPGRNISQKLH